MSCYPRIYLKYKPVLQWFWYPLQSTPQVLGHPVLVGPQDWGGDGKNTFDRPGCGYFCCFYKGKKKGYSLLRVIVDWIE